MDYYPKGSVPIGQISGGNFIGQLSEGKCSAIGQILKGSVAIGQISEGKCCDWKISEGKFAIGQILEGKCCDWKYRREVLRLDNYRKGSVAIGQI